MSRKLSISDPVTLRSIPFWSVGNSLRDPFGGPMLPMMESLAAAMEEINESTPVYDDDLVPVESLSLEDELDPKGELYDNLRECTKILEDAGLHIYTAACCRHGIKLNCKGGLANPGPKVRALAKRKVERAPRIGAFFGATHYTFLTSMKKLLFLHFGSPNKALFDSDFPPLIGRGGLKEAARQFWVWVEAGWNRLVEYDFHLMRTDGALCKPVGCREDLIRARMKGFAKAPLWGTPVYS